jgi:hypothetical protein
LEVAPARVGLSPAKKERSPMTYKKKVQQLKEMVCTYPPLTIARHTHIEK